MDTYEKKYKEALELARVAAFNGHQSLMEGIFPELAESEDEKIRKRIIALVNAHGQGMYKDEILAWLEKQGEQKPTDNIEPKFNVGDAIKITGINNGHTGYSILNTEDGYYYNWKLIDKKTAWSEEDELVVKDIEEAITNYWHGQTQEDLLDRLKSLKQRIGG